MPKDRPVLTTNNSASVGFAILKLNNLESYLRWDEPTCVSQELKSLERGIEVLLTLIQMFPHIFSRSITFSDDSSS